MADDGELLSLSEAAERYEVSSSTLAFRLRVGEIPGRKVRGPRNQEWRVKPSDLEAAGYLPRESPGAEDEALAPEVRKAFRSMQKGLEEQRRHCVEQSQELQRLEDQLRALREAIRSSQR